MRLIVESNWNHPTIFQTRDMPNMRLLNALTARDMVTLKVFAFVGRNVSNTQEIINCPRRKKSKD